MFKPLSLPAFLLLALLAWAGLLLFTRFVSPSTLSAFVAFFLLLDVALTCTITPLAYMLGRFVLSPRYRTSKVVALRQGALFALVIVLNLILSAFNSWSIFACVAVLGAAVVIEVLALARK